MVNLTLIQGADSKGAGISLPISGTILKQFSHIVDNFDGLT
jgi:hypothetical protein